MLQIIKKTLQELTENGKKVTDKVTDKMTDKENAGNKLKYIWKSIKNEEVQKLLLVSEATAKRFLGKMTELELLEAGRTKREKIL